MDGRRRGAQVSHDLKRSAGLPAPWEDWGSSEEIFLLPEMRLAIWYVALRGYEVRYTGQFVRLDGLVVPRGPALEAMTARKLRDEFLLDYRVRLAPHPVEGLSFTSAGLRMGFDRAIDILKYRRFSGIVDGLNVVLPLAEKLRARAMLRRLVERVFETEPDLTEAVLLQWMLNVKRAAIDLPLSRHLFVLVGGDQAGGKSEFVKRLLGPLEELASAPMSLYSLLREPHGSIFSLLGINLDDTEPLVSARDRAKFKKRITSDFEPMRILHSSEAAPVRMRAQYIGSSNFDLAELFPDPTGMRRYVMLKFRNGDVKRGGTPGVWVAVDEADFGLIWRSIDVDEPSFIEPLWGRLGAYQHSNQLKPGLRQWLEGLDIHSYEMGGVIVHGWAKSSQLYGRFVADTGSDMSVQAFGREMKKLLNLKTVPFDQYDRRSSGSAYRVRGHHED